MRSIHLGQIVVTTALVLLAPLQAAGQLTASFTATELHYNGDADECDPVPFGLPTCELYFKMGIFYNNVLQGSMKNYPLSCGVQDLDDGTWDFPDQLVTVPIPDLGDHAQIYFTLFDEDASPDEDDLLGRHSATYSHSVTTSAQNNDSSIGPYSDTSCSGASIDNTTLGGRFTLSFSVDFTDSSAPLAPSAAPVHKDWGGGSTGWDDDTTLDFAWSAGTDPNSGIAGHQLEFAEDGLTVVTQWFDSTANTADVCASGCDITHTVQDGSSYSVRVRARNGATIDLSNAAFSDWTLWSSPAVVDLTDPVTAIDSPAAGSWQGGDFSVSFSDSDANLTDCLYRINDGALLDRSCNTPVLVSVGADAADDCQVEGDGGLNVCVVEGVSTDQVGHLSAFDSRSFGIDYSGDAVESLTATDEPAGAVIAEDEWTTDRDPTFSWTAPTSASPVVGYSYAFSIDPDCDPVETTDTSLSLPTDSLADGVHSFRVRAVDTVGNCGPVASRTVQVDAAADAIDSLAAYTESGGVAIFSGVEQDDATPYLEWAAASSVSPIAGFSYATGDSVDCEIDTTATSTTIGPLSAGTTTFRLRAVDEAGNCGDESTFDIVVSVSDAIFDDGFETGDTTAWSASVP